MTATGAPLNHWLQHTKERQREEGGSAQRSVAKSEFSAYLLKGVRARKTERVQQDAKTEAEMVSLGLRCSPVFSPFSLVPPSAQGASSSSPSSAWAPRGFLRGSRGFRRSFDEVQLLDVRERNGGGALRWRVPKEKEQRPYRAS